MKTSVHIAPLSPPSRPNTSLGGTTPQPLKSTPLPAPLALLVYIPPTQNARASLKINVSLPHAHVMLDKHACTAIKPTPRILVRERKCCRQGKERISVPLNAMSFPLHISIYRNPYKNKSSTTPLRPVPLFPLARPSQNEYAETRPRRLELKPKNSLVSPALLPPSSQSTLSSICKKVRLTSGSQWDAAHPSCDSPNTSRRFALGASNVCLVGENLTCSVPAL